MIKSLKLFAGCVESLRTAEKVYEENKTEANKRNVTDLWAKVDAWIEWVHQQEDAGLARKVPPFIGKLPSSGSDFAINYDLFEKLKENHTKEEMDRFTQLFQGKLNV